MKSYRVTSVDNVAGLLMLTIAGNGDGIQNNSRLKDEHNNMFIVTSVAMLAGRSKIGDETILSVTGIDVKGPIGETVFVV